MKCHRHLRRRRAAQLRRIALALSAALLAGSAQAADYISRDATIPAVNNNGGAALSSDAAITIADIAAMSFDHTGAYSDSGSVYGGAVYSSSNVTLTGGAGSVISMTGNSAVASGDARGGAICAHSFTSVPLLTLSADSITFTRNETRSTGGEASGGAIYAKKARISGGRVALADNNTSTEGGVAQGGAIYAGANKEALAITAGSIVMDNNRAVTTADAGPYKNAFGGAIFSAGGVSMDSDGELRLSADIASSAKGDASGGAIYASMTVKLSGTEIAVVNNLASSSSGTSRGGAIYSMLGDAVLKADESITFSGNAAHGSKHTGGAIWANKNITLTAPRVDVKTAADTFWSDAGSITIDGGLTAAPGATFIARSGTVTVKNGTLTLTGVAHGDLVTADQLTGFAGAAVDLGDATLSLVNEPAEAGQSRDVAVVAVSTGTITLPGVTSPRFSLTSSDIDITHNAGELAQLPSGFTAKKLTLTAASLPLLWAGRTEAGDDAVWEAGTRRNWLVSPDRSAFSDFRNGDAVTFDASGAPSVVVSGEVKPASMTVTGGVYEFTGTGTIAAGDITVNNEAGLTTAVTFAGGNAAAKTLNVLGDKQSLLSVGSGTTLTAEESTSVQGRGRINVLTGGTLHAGALLLAENAMIDNSGSLGAASLNVQGEVTLYNRNTMPVTGEVTQSGGSLYNYEGTLSAGAYTLSGGKLESSAPLTVRGEFAQRGGSAELYDTLTAASFTLADGELTHLKGDTKSGSVAVTTAFTQSGGTLTVNGARIKDASAAALRGSGSAVLTISGGSLYIAGAGFAMASGTTYHIAADFGQVSSTAGWATDTSRIGSDAAGRDISYAVARTASGVTVTITGVNKSLTWTGRTNLIWGNDLLSALNWKDESGAQTFENGDAVTFAEGIGETVIQLEGDLIETSQMTITGRKRTDRTFEGSSSTGAKLYAGSIAVSGGTTRFASNVSLTTPTLTVTGGETTIASSEAVIYDDSWSNGSITVRGADTKLRLNGKVMTKDVSLAGGELTIANDGSTTHGSLRADRSFSQSGGTLELVNSTGHALLSGNSAGTLNVTGGRLRIAGNEGAGSGDVYPVAREFGTIENLWAPASIDSEAALPHPVYVVTSSDEYWQMGGEPHYEGKKADVTIYGGNADVVWNGTSGDLWRAGATDKKWTISDDAFAAVGANKTPADFWNGDRALFDGSTSGTVVVSGEVKPATMTVLGGTHAFARQDAGSTLTVGGAYRQTGNGTVVSFDMPVTVKGAASLEGGTLTLRDTLTVGDWNSQPAQRTYLNIDASAYAGNAYLKGTGSSPFTAGGNSVVRLTGLTADDLSRDGVRYHIAEGFVEDAAFWENVSIKNSPAKHVFVSGEKSGGSFDAVVYGGNARLLWRSTDGGFWNNSSAAGWTISDDGFAEGRFNGQTNEKFYNGDSVVFDDENTGEVKTVVVTAATMQVTGGTHTFTGAGDAPRIAVTDVVSLDSGTTTFDTPLSAREMDVSGGTHTFGKTFTADGVVALRGGETTFNGPTLVNPDDFWVILAGGGTHRFGGYLAAHELNVSSGTVSVASADLDVATLTGGELILSGGAAPVVSIYNGYAQNGGTLTVNGAAVSGDKAAMAAQPGNFTTLAAVKDARLKIENAGYVYKAGATYHIASGFSAVDYVWDAASVDISSARGRHIEHAVVKTSGGVDVVVSSDSRLLTWTNKSGSGFWEEDSDARTETGTRPDKNWQWTDAKGAPVDDTFWESDGVIFAADKAGTVLVLGSVAPMQMTVDGGQTHYSFESDNGGDISADQLNVSGAVFANTLEFVRAHELNVSGDVSFNAVVSADRLTVGEQSGTVEFSGTILGLPNPAVEAGQVIVAGGEHVRFSSLSADQVDVNGGKQVSFGSTEAGQVTVAGGEQVSFNSLSADSVSVTAGEIVNFDSVSADSMSIATAETTFNRRADVRELALTGGQTRVNRRARLEMLTIDGGDLVIGVDLVTGDDDAVVAAKTVELKSGLLDLNAQAELTAGGVEQTGGSASFGGRLHANEYSLRGGDATFYPLTAEIGALTVAEEGQLHLAGGAVAAGTAALAGGGMRLDAPLTVRTSFAQTGGTLTVSGDLTNAAAQGSAKLLGDGQSSTLAASDGALFIETGGASIDGAGETYHIAAGFAGGTTAWKPSAVSTDAAGMHLKADVTAKNGAVDVQFLAGHETLTWRGADGGEWKAQDGTRARWTFDWQGDTISDDFYNGDSVIFDAAAVGRVVLPEAVTAAGMTVTGGRHSFSGEDLSAGSLTVSGGAATFANALNVTGKVAITAGETAFDGSVLADAFNITGGETAFSGSAAARSATLADGRTVVTGKLTTNSLTQSGGELSLTAAGALTVAADANGTPGTFAQTGGTLTVNSEAAQKGAVIVASGDAELNASKGTLFINGVSASKAGTAYHIASGFAKLVPWTDISGDMTGARISYNAKTDEENGVFDVIVSVKNTAVTWNGGSGTWAQNDGKKNWLINSTGEADDFYNGDSVTFAKDAAGTVTLSGDLEAAAMLVNGGEYTFDGSGTLNVTGGLSLTGGSALFAREISAQNATLTGNAKLTLEQALKVTGAFVQSGGTLIVDVSKLPKAALLGSGSATLTIDSGALKLLGDEATVEGSTYTIASGFKNVASVWADENVSGEATGTNVKYAVNKGTSDVSVTVTKDADPEPKPEPEPEPEPEPTPTPDPESRRSPFILTAGQSLRNAANFGASLQNRGFELLGAPADIMNYARYFMPMKQDKVGGVWASTWYSHARVDNDSADMKFKNYGVTIGADKQFGTGVAGLAVNLGKTEGRGRGKFDGSDSDGKHIGVSLYGARSLGNFTLTGDIGYNWHRDDYDSTSGGDYYSARRGKSRVFTVGGTAWWNLRSNGRVNIKPFLGVRYSHFSMDDLSVKKNGADWSTIGGESVSQWTVPLGVKFDWTPMTTKKGWKIKPSVELAYVYAGGDRAMTVRETVLSGGSAARSTQMLTDKSNFRATLGLDAKRNNLTLGLGVNALLSSGQKDVAVNATLRWDL